MRRNTACVLAALALTAGSIHQAASGESVCPPGAKFCPAPGTDNTAFMNSYFGVDPDTGQVMTYNGTGQQANNDHLETGERLLYVAPNVQAESRFVPPEIAFGNRPAAPAPAPYAPVQQAYVAPSPAYAPPPVRQQTVLAQQPAFPAQPQPAAVASNYPPQNPRENRAAVTANARPSAFQADPASEVANETSRKSRKEPVANDDDRVPWWKGGMWRNKKDKDDNDSGSRNNDSGSASARSGSTTQVTRAPRMDDDSMWDDGEYSGYNADGSFGRAAAPAPAPYNDPYAQPQGAPYDPYANPTPSYGQASAYAGPDEGTASWISEPYTLPADNSGYGAPYAAYSDGTASSYDSGPTASAWSGGGDQWAPPAPQAAPSPFQAAPSIDAQGSPQFENAVRMVKENRFSEAKSILASETSRNPSNAAAWRWLADCHYNLLELDDAVNCYQRSLERDPNDYYALRGQGFSYLHRGHEYWRRMQEEVSQGQKDQAAATFAQAHENYKKSLELLGLCLRRAPNDGEAVYGEAMAAEGASRKLYSNAISYLKLGPDQRERAELFAENCLTVINKGVERSKERAKQLPGDAGPRALMGGLYLRKAILYHQLGKNDLALIELRNSRDVQKSIIDEIDKNNPTALKNIQEVERYWEEWGGNRN